MKQLMMAVVGLCLGSALWLAPYPLAAQSSTDPGVVLQSAPITATVTSGSTRLRVRSGPGVEYPIVTRLNNGQTVTVVARNERGDWLLVTAPGAPTGQGWASASYLRLAAPLDQVPTVTYSAPSAPAPNAPAPQPTALPAPMLFPPQVALPAPSGLYGTLAVPVFDASRQTYDIWTVNADGTGLRQVVTEASAPALSLDGSLLAYRRWRVDDRGIVVAWADGSAPLRITDKLEDTLPSFSPDRSKVAFSSYRESDRKHRLYYAWTDEQNRRAWEWGPGGIYGEDPDWLPDNRIYFRVYRLGDSVDQLWSMSGRDGLDQRQLFATKSMLAPDANASGASVVYMSSASGNWEIYRLEVATGEVTQLTDNAAADGLPVWSPNGEYVAFVSDRSGRWGLWVMDADGSNERLIVNLPGAVDGRVQFEPDYLNHGWLEEQIAWGM